LVNDFYQLPPIKQKPLYYPEELYDIIEIAGRNTYIMLDYTIELKTIQRQRRPEKQAFRNVLNGLRVNRPNIQHWELLCIRIQTNLTLTNVAAFDSTLRLYTTNSQINKYNFDYIIQLDAPYIQVYTTNNNPKAEKVNIINASNLYNTIPLYVDTYVILLKNLWQKTDFVNNALNKVVDIV